MKTLKSILILLLLAYPVNMFAQGYLGNSSNSVLSIADDIYQFKNPDGSLILEEARKKILDELSILYGLPGEPLDTEEVKIIIDTSNNFPILRVLDKDYYKVKTSIENYDISNEYRSGGISYLINILENVIIGKSTTAAKSVLFNALLGTVLQDEEFKILFKNSSNYFETFNISKLKASPKIFTEAFKSDIKILPFNIPQIFQKVGKYKKVVSDNPYLALYLEANRYYKELRNLKPVFEINHNILTNLVENNLTEDIKTKQYSDLFNSLKLLQYVYFQLNPGSSYETQGYYTKRAKLSPVIKELKKSNTLTDIFLGLVCAQNPDIRFARFVKETAVDKSSKTSSNITKRSGGKVIAGTLSVTPIIKYLTYKNEKNKIMDYISNYTEKYDATVEILDSMEYYTDYGDPIPEELKDLYFDKSIEFLEYSMNPFSLYPDGEFDKTEINHFIEIIKKYRELERNIVDEQNLAAMMNSFYIYGDLCKTHEAFGLLFNNFSGNFLQGISITADLLSAKNDEEIADIANEYLFSGTDANAKKESDFNILLNSYGGIYYGKQSENITNNWTRNRGIFAPIGLEISRGLKDYGSLSIFIPVFDLGAIIDFRLSNDSAEIQTNFELDNIISPGLYLSYGFPKIPLSVGGGFQFSPHLGKVTLDGKVIEPRKLRWNFFLAFDLPLIKIFGF